MTPYSLATLKQAAAELTKALDKSALKMGDSRHGEDQASSRAIFAFLDKLAVWPEGMNELHRRATIVGELCGHGSSYEHFRQRVLSRLVRRVQNEAVGSVRGKLTAISENPVQLVEVDRTASLIELGILTDSSSTIRELLEHLLRACRDVQRRADGLHVDGCWLLAQHLREMQQEPQKGMGVITALTRSGLGSGNRALIRSAVAALVEPIDQLAFDPAATRRKVNKGRPPRSKANLQTDETLVNDWEKARESGVAKKDFTKDRGMTVRELDRVVDRVKKRGKRSPTKS